MANLLFDDPNQWSDDGTTPGPPVSWNGTEYVATNGISIIYLGTISDGDTLGCYATWENASASDSVFISDDVNPELISLSTTPANGSAGFIYTCDGTETRLRVQGTKSLERTTPVTFAPMPALFAPDEHLKVLSWTAPAVATTVSVAPDITLGGVSVAPHSLYVVTSALHGVRSSTTPALSYSSNSGFVGQDSFTYFAGGGYVLRNDFVVTVLRSNVATVTVDVTATSTWCMELGRATRCYVSGFQRNRVHECRIVRGELRCLIADFNGALPKGQLIASATWRCWNGSVAVMSNARIKDDQRETAIDLMAALPGGGMVKCEVTNDHGEVYNQLFRIIVGDGYWFNSEQNPGQGPLILTATVPVVP